MSPEPFSKLAERFPDHETVWAALGGWAHSHRRVKFLDAPRLGTLLAKKLHLDPAEATHVLSLIFDSGLFTQMYAVMSPSGVVCGPWKEIEDIPEQIEVSFGTFDAEEGDIVPVLVEASSDVQPA